MCAAHIYHTNKQVRTGRRKVIGLPKKKINTKRQAVYTLELVSSD